MLKKTINTFTHNLTLFYKGYGFYKKQILILTFLGFVGGLLEGVGINAVIPVFSFLTGSSNHGGDIISRTIESLFGVLGITFSLRYLLVFIFLVFLARAIVLAFNSYIRIRIITDYTERVCVRLFEKVVRADWAHLLKQKLGHLNTLLVTNVSYSESLLQKISAIITLVTGLVMYIVVAVNISLTVTLLTVFIGGLLFLVFRPILNMTRSLSSKVESLNRIVAHFVNENVFGLKTVKSMMADRSIVAKSKIYFHDLKNLRTKVFFLGFIPDTLMPLVGIMFVLVVFAVSYKLPNFNLAALAAVVYLINKIFVYFQQLQGAFQSVSEYRPYLEAVIRYEDEAVMNEENDGKGDRFSFDKSLDFESVRFGYEGKKDIFKDLSFSVKQGEMVGIIGPSGVGKTTVVDLILRLFKPLGGSITVDGKNIDSVALRDWRMSVGYVSQDMFLINDTIANNIRFYDSSLTEDEIIKASKMADIYDVIMKSPQKFGTVIGERGIMLSAGQRQRIIIARVLARRPKLLILDEATSALDNESEAEVQSVIENLKGKITVIVIAHRLTTVINSDKLIVIGEGKVIEEGNPATLLKDKESYFYRLYEKK